MRKALPYIIVALMALVDTSVLGILSSNWATPMLAYTSVIAIGLLLGRGRGLFCGLFAGFIIDVSVGYPLGLMMALFALAGYLSGYAGRRYQRYVLTVFLTSMLMLLVYELVMSGYQLMAGQTIDTIGLYRALIRVGIQTVLAQVMYLLYNMMLKPSWSRYAGR